VTLIGDEIKRTRKAVGMTSRDVATQATLTPQYVRLIECGDATPAMDTMLRICNLFPDADSGYWAWLLIRDLYGEGMFDLLWTYAQRAGQPDRAG
jgi:transcriptional regulator with XRE-family HTH domain